MNFKLDENLHPENGELLRERGHDVATVHDQGLRGHEDQEIAEVCRQEGRILLSFDLDFSNIQMFPPRTTRASSSSGYDPRGGKQSARFLRKSSTTWTRNP